MPTRVNLFNPRLRAVKRGSALSATRRTRLDGPKPALDMDLGLGCAGPHVWADYGGSSWVTVCDDGGRALGCIRE